MTKHTQELLTTYPKPGQTKEKQQVDEETVSLQALNITNSLAFPMVFKSALELGVLDTIAAAGEGLWLSSSEIVLALPTKPIGSANVARPDVTVTSELVCKFFLNRSEDSGSLMSPLFMLLHSHAIFKTWTHLKDVIEEGKDAFSSAHGMRLFDYICLNEQFAGLFNQAMSQSSTMIMKKILKDYKGFKDVNTLVDIGRGLGTILNLVTSKYPHIKGINFDLAAVLANAPFYPGVDHVSGDMLIEVPQGDAIFMKWILHDWNDEDCVKILKNYWKSLPEKGKVILVEMVTPTEPKSDDLFSKITFGMDMLMLTQCSGGKERSFSQFEALASASGFLNCEIVGDAYSYSVIEFHK